MKYALGPFGMLCDALRRHQRDPKHRGAPPKRIIMHPAVFIDLKQGLMEKERYYLSFTDDGSVRFMNIPVIIDSSSEYPRLVTCKNVVEYL